MAIEVGPVRSRRALIGAAVGGLAAVAAGAIGRPQAVRAAGTNPVELGAVNTTTATTTIRHASGSPSLQIAGNSLAGATAESNVQFGWGLRGDSNGADGAGVVGHANGTNGIAVLGQSSGHFSQIAVDADGRDGNGQGIAVRGRTKNGIAVYGEATQSGGYALQAVGRAVFSRSGKVTFNAGQATKTISANITAASLVLATIQGNVANTWVRGVSLVIGTPGSFTIRLNKAAPSALTVGWFIVN